MKSSPLLALTTLILLLVPPAQATVLLSWNSNPEGAYAPGGSIEAYIAGNLFDADSLPFDSSLTATRNVSSVGSSDPYSASAHVSVVTSASESTFFASVAGTAEHSGNGLPSIGLAAYWDVAFSLNIDVSEPTLVQFNVSGDTVTSFGEPIVYSLNSEVLAGSGSLILTGSGNNLTFVMGREGIDNVTFGDGPPSARTMNSSIALSFTPVPEPATAALIFVAVIAGLMFRRVRSRPQVARP